MRAEDPGGSGPAGLLRAAPSAALTDVAEFLRAHAPFEALPAGDVDAVAATTQIEFHLAGETILSQGEEPVAHVRVVRSGAVELIHDGVLLDLLGPGELFGHDSMLSGLPAGFTARANEDTLCYRIAHDVARTVLSRPESAVFVARSLLTSPNIFADGGPSAVARRDPAHQPVSALIHGELVAVAPDTSIREAARLMTAGEASAVIVRLPASLGIVTDRDLRTRVVAGGVAVDNPVSSVMTAPAYTVAPDRLGGGVLLEMLDRGVRHFPVISSRGAIQPIKIAGRRGICWQLKPAPFGTSVQPEIDAFRRKPEAILNDRERTKIITILAESRQRMGTGEVARRLLALNNEQPSEARIKRAVASVRVWLTQLRDNKIVRSTKSTHGNEHMWELANCCDQIVAGGLPEEPKATTSAAGTSLPAESRT